MVLNGHNSRNIFRRNTTSSARSLIMDDATQRYHASAYLETDGAGYHARNPMQLGDNSRLDFLVTYAGKRKFGKFAAKRRDEIGATQDARKAVALDHWNAPDTVLLQKAHDLAERCLLSNGDDLCCHDVIHAAAVRANVVQRGVPRINQKAEEAGMTLAGACFDPP
jgi:hypothetical protein